MSKRTSRIATKPSRFLSAHTPRGPYPTPTIVQLMADQRMVDILRLAKERLGSDHPLVVAAVDSLAEKEARRVENVTYDGLTAEVLGGYGKPNPRHARENAIAAKMTEILSEEPIREARLPACRYRVDMLFRLHDLAVEEDGPHHNQRDVKARDAHVDALCAKSGIKILRIKPKDSIDHQALRERVAALGIAV